MKKQKVLFIDYAWERRKNSDDKSANLKSQKQDKISHDEYVNLFQKIKRKKEQAGQDFNDLLSGLGISDEKRYFKGREDGNGNIIDIDSYAFYEEDADKVLKLIDYKGKISFIKNGSTDKIIKKDGTIDLAKFSLLEEVVDTIIQLFQSYCADENVCSKIKYHIEATTKINIFRAIKALQEMNKLLLSSVSNISNIYEELENVAAYGIDEEDYIYWSTIFSQELKNFIEKWMDYRSGMVLLREKEFDEKIQNLSEDELISIGKFSQILEQKLKDKEIMDKNESICDEKSVYSQNGPKYIKMLKNRPKIESILKSLETEEGYLPYLKLFCTKASSEDILMRMEIYGSSDAINEEDITEDELEEIISNHISQITEL